MEPVTHNDQLELPVDLHGFIPVSTQISKVKMDKSQEQCLRVLPTVLLCGVLTMITFTYPG